MEWVALTSVGGGLVAGVTVGLVAQPVLARVASRVGSRLRQHGHPSPTASEGARADRSPATAEEQQAPSALSRTVTDLTPAGGEDPLALAVLARKSVDALRVGVVVLDGRDAPVLVNPAARAMGLLRTGPTPGSIAAHPIVRTLCGQVRRTGVRREVELNLPRGREGGPQDSLAVHLRAIGLGGGFVAVEAADVTESHRVARVRRDFVANVSHELKTPIGALQLLAEALLDATEPPAGTDPVGRSDPAGAGPSEDMVAARRFADRIQHESVRLGRLVNELLELTRLQGAEPLPEPEPVSVDWVVSEVVDRTRTAATARRIEIAVGGRRGLTVYGSDTQIATAVTNLVDNAIAYSAEETTVSLITGVDDGHVQISVTDQGIGIAPTDLNRVFERFYRADQARSRATGGTGLGLAIVKHIATNHGGRVVVSSTLGGGSTFTLRLPASPPDATAAPPGPVGIETGPAGDPSGQTAERKAS